MEHPSLLHHRPFEGGDGKHRQADYSEFMIQQFLKKNGATTSLNFTFDLWLQRLQTSCVSLQGSLGGSQHR